MTVASVSADEQSATPLRRILLDCSFTCQFPQIRAGIPRVVRNVAGAAPQVATALGSRCETVLAHEGQYYSSNWNPQGVAARKPLVQKVVRKLSKLVSKAFAVQINEKRSALMTHALNRPIVYEPGDLVLILDAFWAYPQTIDLSEARRAGAKVGLVAYDLIPITHQHFCAPEHVAIFSERLHALLPQIDFFVAISRTVSVAVQKYVQEHFPHLEFPDEAFTWFPLGAQLLMGQPLRRMSTPLRRIFDNGPWPYLCVCTLAPHKNHQTLLDAFEQVWQRHPEARLCIVGNRGWMVDDLVARIEQHPRFGRQLFWLKRLTDTELAYCYQRSRAFLFASFVEGFGLPIVEALQHGLRVFASDIAVHREVGGEFCTYFDPRRPDELAELITACEEGQVSKEGTMARFVGCDWQSSARQLLEKCITRFASVARPAA